MLYILLIDKKQSLKDSSLHKYIDTITEFIKQEIYL